MILLNTCDWKMIGFFWGKKDHLIHKSISVQRDKIDDRQTRTKEKEKEKKKNIYNFVFCRSFTGVSRISFFSENWFLKFLHVQRAPYQHFPTIFFRISNKKMTLTARLEKNIILKLLMNNSNEEKRTIFCSL